MYFHYYDLLYAHFHIAKAPLKRFFPPPPKKESDYQKEVFERLATNQAKVTQDLPETELPDSLSKKLLEKLEPINKARKPEIVTHDDAVELVAAFIDGLISATGLKSISPPPPCSISLPVLQ